MVATMSAGMNTKLPSLTRNPVSGRITSEGIGGNRFSTSIRKATPA
jgi:hypothetical protein